MKFASVLATLASLVPTLVAQADTFLTASGTQKLDTVSKAASTALVIAGNAEKDVEAAKPAVKQIVSLFADFKHDLEALVSDVETTFGSKPAAAPAPAAPNAAGLPTSQTP